MIDRDKARVLAVGLAAWLIAVGCSSTVEADSESEEKTPLAVFEAQTELYEALFEEPPDLDRAVSRMAEACGEETSEPSEIVAEPLAEVELIRSGGIDEQAVLDAFADIAYEITEDTALGIDGSEWVYEQGRWRSLDC